MFHKDFGKKESDLLYTVKKAAEFMDVHPDTMRRWADNGEIKSTRHPINNYRVFFLADLMELRWKIEDQKNQ
ncbi:MAG: MerR family DNA-binding transcriptional regulator [Bdellovibrionaceae bacterium]|nr:MerR family DNA-binding transcriptional regulator [Pseudobdellovibrionaceae bacterium]|tara:strand:- start:1879 stop:2094 length:216 start_codon:yes stop_codon:yes gene_type:complete